MPAWGKRLLRITSVALFVTGLLLVSFNVYSRSTLSAPLEKELQQLSFVRDVEVEHRPQPRVIVTLGPVSHLREAYMQLEPIVTSRLHEVTVPIVIVDRRTPDLVAAFYQLRPYVMEAAARGNVAEMDRHFDAAAKRLGLVPPSSFTIDSRYVYVQLHDTSGGFMYVVEPYVVPNPRPIEAGRWQS